MARTTLQHWLAGKHAIGESPALVAFLESPEGLAFIYRLITAAHLEFTKNGVASIHNVSNFLKMIGLSPFVASSYPASVELSEFSAKVGNESPGFIDVPVEPQCTEYCRGNGGWLDHAVVTAATRELAVQQAVVHGYCNMANCDRLSDMPNAYEALSDHCPVVIDFQNTDID